MCYVWVQISIAAFGYHIFTYLDPTKIRTIGPLLALFNQEKSSLSCVTFGLCSCVYHNLANYCCHRWHRKVYVWWTSTELHCKMFFQWNHWCFKNTICRGTDFIWLRYQWLSRLDSSVFFILRVFLGPHRCWWQFLDVSDRFSILVTSFGCWC